MLTKIKDWIFGKVIASKVIGKFAKHGAGVIIAFLFGDKIPLLKQTLEAMNLTEPQVEAGIIVAATGLFGALFNFIQHRKK